MAVRLFVLLLASLPVIAQAQTALPPDINPVTLSRLPPVTPEDLDEEGRQLLAKNAGGQAGAGAHARHELQPQGAQPRDPYGREQPRRPAVLSAGGAHHREGNRPAVRVVGPRARGLEARTRAVGHRRRQVQQGRRGPIRQGRHAHHLRTHAVSRAPREQRAVAEDDRTLRAAAHGAAHDDHGRLLQGGLHDERRRSAPSAGSEGAAAAVESITRGLARSSRVRWSPS